MKTADLLKRSVALFTLALAWAATPAVAETTNCTAITSVPYTITVQGVYCFTDNISAAIDGGSAIAAGG